MGKLSVLAIGLSVGIVGACGTTSEDDDLTTAFVLRIENVAPWKVLKAGTQTMKVDGTTGGAGPGAAFEVAFTAGRHQQVSFASMLGQSNDWFFGPNAEGLSLYNEDGNPIVGDITDQVYLWDAGTELDQEPAVGDATGPRQPSPEYGAPDPDAMVQRLGQQVTLDDGSTFALPPIDAMIRVTLNAVAEGQFVLRIENVSTATTLVTSQGTSGVGVSPPAWALHTDRGPIFEGGTPDRGQGLEDVAESGRSARLGGSLAALAGTSTPVSPGVYAVHRDPEALFALGVDDLGIGLESLAEDGNWAPLLATVSTYAAQMQLVEVGGFDTPAGATQIGPARPGAAFEVVVRGAPGDHVSFATMFGWSNDWFFATRPEGIALFDEWDAPRRGDVTSALALYDAGTEVDQELAIGRDTGPQQTGPNTGAADPLRQVREVSPTRHAPAVSSHLRVTLTPM
jgi:hypothetical protein